MLTMEPGMAYPSRRHPLPLFRSGNRLFEKMLQIPILLENPSSESLQNPSRLLERLNMFGPFLSRIFACFAGDRGRTGAPILGRFRLRTL